MAADTIVEQRTLLAGPGDRPAQLRYEVTVTNGMKAVSLTIKTIRTSPTGKTDESTTYVTFEDLENAHLLADALIRKAVNVNRGVHDNSDGAI